MTASNESVVEEAALEWLHGLGYAVRAGDRAGDGRGGA